MIDIHSHVLPGLDDGPCDLAESIQMCRIAAEDGIKTLVATPHMLCDSGNPSTSDIRSACNLLSESLEKEGIDIQIRYAAEVRMIEDLAKRVERGEIPAFDNKGRYVLLEPARLGRCGEALSDLVFRLQLKDITPVIAHPEYVEAFFIDPVLLQRVVDQGALIQVTASSIVNSPFDSKKTNVIISWMKEGLVHFVASDAHDSVKRIPVLSEAKQASLEILGEEGTEQLFNINPISLLAGDDIS